jgi:hypothetical protein
VFLSELQIYLKENAYLIFALAAIALAAYGFELFNFNLTIDEEIHAAIYGPVRAWVMQGRWGMYLLNDFLMPYTVIPFVPLFVALVFHIGAILLMLNSWKVRSLPQQVIVGALSIAFPIMAYMYTFSTINYGIGIGLFCIALSLFIYAKNSGAKRFYAVIPAAFSLAIYQGFIPALIAVFLIYLISTLIYSHKISFKDLTVISFIHILALLVYSVVQQIFVVIMLIPHDPYTSGVFDFSYLLHNLGAVLFQTFRYSLLPIYFGSKSLYAVDVNALGFLLIVSFFGLIAGLWLSKSSKSNRLLILVFFLLLVVLPFASVLLMRGDFSLRMLIALPIAIPGIVMLGMLNSSRDFKILVALLTAYCVFQFITSTNHLFASSHLALQADRVLASQLIGRIADAQTEAGSQDLQYMEIIGWYSRPPTELIPQIETFGASFFGWPQGTSIRAISFLETLGFEKLQVLPIDKRGQMIDVVNLMPIWPEKGSVRVVGDVVLVKFGPYSDGQKQEICGSAQNQMLLQSQDFCKP